MGKQWKHERLYGFGAQKSLQMMIAAMRLKDAYSLEGKLQRLTLSLSSTRTEAEANSK